MRSRECRSLARSRSRARFHSDRTNCASEPPWSQGRTRCCCGSMRCRFDHWPCLSIRKRRGCAPAPPRASLRQTSATLRGGGLPSGRHRTRKLDGASAAGAPLARSASTAKTSKHRSTDQERFGCLPEGSRRQGCQRKSCTEALRGCGGYSTRIRNSRVSRIYRSEGRMNDSPPCCALATKMSWSRAAMLDGRTDRHHANGVAASAARLLHEYCERRTTLHRKCVKPHPHGSQLYVARTHVTRR